jgi:hypothetical protein
MARLARAIQGRKTPALVALDGPRKVGHDIK